MFYFKELTFFSKSHQCSARFLLKRILSSIFFKTSHKQRFISLLLLMKKNFINLPSFIQSNSNFFIWWDEILYSWWFIYKVLINRWVIHAYSPFTKMKHNLKLIFFTKFSIILIENQLQRVIYFKRIANLSGKFSFRKLGF